MRKSRGVVGRIMPETELIEREKETRIVSICEPSQSNETDR